MKKGNYIFICIYIGTNVCMYVCMTQYYVAAANVKIVETVVLSVAATAKANISMTTS